MGKSKAQQELEAKAKQTEAVRLKAQGWTLDMIADELGYADKSGAKYALDAGLARMEVTNATEMRKLHNVMLEEQYMVAHTTLRQILVSDEILEQTSVDDILACLSSLRQTETRMAQLLGIDLPARVDVDLTVTTPEEKRAQLKEMVKDVKGLPPLPQLEPVPESA
jgi:hypothetical protein